ncbi:RNA polymerase sigma factor SigF [Sinomonas cyclohexanicum]|uniref:RNA polymerase sigma factor SigF n=1 Tax=Sinomonas cyclohexanicum TaxID=322009 RepID=A0ABN6FQ55_SINCY|nr:RNA polymerase sigma factor SigF [Corynebacterium cyclohexanicum]
MSESKTHLRSLPGGAATKDPVPTRSEGPRPEPADLVLEYLGVADALARRHRAPGHDVEDLRQVARLGLVRAAQRYREDCGHGFLQYAVPTISGTIKHYLRDNSWTVRPPRRLQELRLSVRAAQGRLTQDLGREPSVAELSEATGAAEDEVAEARGVSAAMNGVEIDSLDAGPDSDGSAGHVVPIIDAGFERVEQRELVAAALNGCSDEDLRLVKMRFVDEMSQREIAEVLGVSQMQVSRLLRGLLSRMRRKLAA